MGDDDALGFGRLDIDRVIAHTVATDDLEVGQTSQNLRLDPIVAVCDHMGDFCRVIAVQLADGKGRFKGVLSSRP